MKTKYELPPLPAYLDNAYVVGLNPANDEAYLAVGIYRKAEDYKDGRPYTVQSIRGGPWFETREATAEDIAAYDKVFAEQFAIAL